MNENSGLIRALPMDAYPPEADFESRDEMVSFLNALWIECAKEYNTYGGRTHGNVRTYNEGCRGPVCRQSVRITYREKNDTEPRGVYVWLDPIISYYRDALDELEEEMLKLLQHVRLSGRLTAYSPPSKHVPDGNLSAKLLQLLDKVGAETP